MKTLNEILRDLREDHDMKQETIAKYLGISQQAYSNYENGHRKIPFTAENRLHNFIKSVLIICCALIRIILAVWM